jgi:aminoglycoside 6'-N-acetyltransferase I
MVVRPAELEDHEEWLSMRSALWPDCPAAEHVAEVRAYAGAGGRQMAFVAELGSVCGFVEASLRLNAEGCTTTPVGYLEGIYVMPDKRHRGVGRALVNAAEAWAVSRGCTEMASDCLLENLASERFHRNLGYSVAGRVVHFRRLLSKSASPTH